MKTTIVLFALFSTALACTCPPLTPFRTAILNAKNSDAPYAVATVVSEDIPVDIFEKVTYTVRPEGCLKTVVVTTAVTSPQCGVRLKVGTKYVLALKKDRSPSTISSCDSYERFNSLSEADQIFVAKNVPGRCLSTTCATILCPVGTICRKGQCIPINSCPIFCPPGTFCRSGKCVDKCIYMKCGVGYICKLGQCIPTKCTKKCTSVDCFQAPCPPLCTIKGCPKGWDCVWGRCISPNPKK